MRAYGKQRIASTPTTVSSLCNPGHIFRVRPYREEDDYRLRGSAGSVFEMVWVSIVFRDGRLIARQFPPPLVRRGLPLSWRVQAWALDECIDEWKGAR